MTIDAAPLTVNVVGSNCRSRYEVTPTVRPQTLLPGQTVTLASLPLGRDGCQLNAAGIYHLNMTYRNVDSNILTVTVLPKLPQ